MLYYLLKILNFNTNIVLKIKNNLISFIFYRRDTEVVSIQPDIPPAVALTENSNEEALEDQYDNYGNYGERDSKIFSFIKQLCMLYSKFISCLE